MSFMRTLATMAVGFAAAKGMDKYQQMGGMAGLQQMMQGGGSGGGGLAGMMGAMGGAGGANPMAGLQDMMGQFMGGAGGANPMAAMMGGGGANPMVAMMEQMGGMGQQAQAAGAAGLGGLMAAMTGAAGAMGQSADDMTQAMFGGTAVTVAQEEQAKMMLRAMIMAAKADGEIDDAERAKIMEMLGEVDAEERAFVEAELAAPLDPMRLATDAGDAVKAQIYATSLTAMQVDTAAEAQYLNQLASVLQLSPDVRSRIHATMGVPLA